MSYRKLAFANGERFGRMEGSEYIASFFAIEIILKIIKKYKVTSILELGLGIGSISDTVLKYASQKKIPITYVGTEKNEFCLNALKQNVEQYEKLQVYPELKDVKGQQFDFVIIDGYDDSMHQIVANCKKHAIIFVEGDRKVQTQKVLEVFPNAKHVNIITLKKFKTPSGASKYAGGGQLIFTNPTIGMKMYWFKEKALTYIKRKFRNYELRD